MIAARVGVAFSGEERVFCGDYEVVPIGFQELAEEALAPALVVFVGGIDEIAAGLSESVKDFSRFVFRCNRTPVLPSFAEGHRAKAELGNPQPAFS